MKKTLLLFAMLLGVVGAWAQRTMPTISDEPKNGEWAKNTTWYTLKTKNGFYYETDLFLNTESKPTAADIAGNHKYQWCITGNETNGYKLYNRYQGASQFLASNKIASGTSDCYFTSEVQDKITTFKFRESTHGDAWWCLQLNGNTAEAYLARNGDRNKGYNLIAWQTGYNTAKGDGGAPITFEEVEDLPEISLTNVQPNGDQLTLYINATSQTLDFSMDSPKELGAKAKFAYVLHDGKYTFYNEASKSFLVWRNNDTSNKGTMSSYNAKYCDWSLTQSQQNGVTYFRMNSKRSGTDNDGTLILLTPVGKKEYRFDGYGNTVGWAAGTNGNQYSNLFTILINCSLYNEASGSTFQLTHSTPDIGVKPTINVEGVTLSNEVFNGGSEYSAKVTFPFPVSSETVANPILIGQGTWDGANSFEKLWKVVDGNVKVVDGTPYLGTSLWLIYPTLTGSEFTYKIKSVSTDKYVTANLARGNDAEATNTPVTLTPNGTEFRYVATTCGSDKGFAYTNDNSTTMYLTRNGESDNDKLLGVHQAKNSHKGNGIRFPEFTEYNVTIGETGYTTVYSPFTAFTYSEALKIYTITSAPQDGRVNLNLITNPQADDVSNYIYENQGVIIKGTPGGTYTFNLFDDEDYYNADAWTNNKLKGSITNTYVQGDAYVLSAPDGVESVGLYKAELNMNEAGEKVGKETGTHFKNNAGKAYLPASEAASDARFLVFSFGDDIETGITETENGNVKTENDEVYDLSGRSVQGAQKGIFIVNGKKVVR